MSILTLEDLRLAIIKDEDISSKVAKIPLFEELIDFDSLTIEEFFSVGLALYWKAQAHTEGTYERGYFWKTEDNGLEALIGFTHTKDGLFITTLTGTDGFRQIYEQ